MSDSSELIDEFNEPLNKECKLRNKKFIHYCNKKINNNYTESNTYRLRNNGDVNYSEIDFESEEDSEDEYENFYT